MLKLSVNTDTIGAEDDAVTERFSVISDDRTTKLGHINGVRNEGKGTFAHKNLLRQKVALEEDTKRTVYQDGHAWGQSMCLQM